MLCGRRYRLQEEQRIRWRPQIDQWKCGFCGQLARSSHYLDGHMDDVHAEKLVQVNSVVTVVYPSSQTLTALGPGGYNIKISNSS